LKKKGALNAMLFVVWREAAVSPNEVPAVMRGAFSSEVPKAVEINGSLWFGMNIRILDRVFLWMARNILL
jgi:hypothetical protein